MSEKTTETLDKLYLEWSQFTKARTYRDIANEKRIEELEEKVRQRGQVIAAHININDPYTSWSRLIVAECIREQGDE